MKAVITGDIVGSARTGHPEEWIKPLRTTLSKYGREPVDWQIYRGDSFQVVVDAPTGMKLLIHLSAAVRAAGFDVRMSLGLGDLTHRAGQVTESIGTAFIHSGQAFETLEKGKHTLVIRSGRDEFDRNWNVIINLLETICNGWTRAAAQVIAMQMEDPEATQNDLAEQLGISQPSVSSRLKVAHAERIAQVLEHYNHTLSLWS